MTIFWRQFSQTLRLRIITLLMFSVFLLFCATVTAPEAKAQPKTSPQTDSTKQNSTPPKTSSESTSRKPVDPDSPSPALRVLKSESGEEIRVPENTTLEAYLEWLANQKGPAFNVTSVNLTGTADDERAVLDATIQVQLNRENEWVLVPLKLNEAILRKTEYKGGEVSFDKYVRGSGYQWWVKGKGLHTFQLTLVVPIHTQVPARRMQLTLPPSAASYLKLILPQERLTVTPPERSVVKTKPAGKGSSEIEVIGLNERLDLQWKPLPNPRWIDASLQAFTSLMVDVTGESVLLTANQRVQAIQGSFSELRVKLPPGFELLEVSIDGTPTSPAENPSPDLNWVTLLLPQDTTGPVEVKWVLEATLTLAKPNLLLSGFQVDQAKRQTGEIAVRTAQGYRVAKQEKDNQFVYRISRSDLIHPDIKEFLDRGQLGGTYRFLSPKYQLALELLEIEPYFTSQPNFTLHASDTGVALSGLYRFQVYRGTLEDLEIIWDQPADFDWEIVPPEVPGLVERVFIDQKANTKILRVKFLKRQEGNFELPISATLKLKPEATQIPFSLPKISASSQLPTLFQLSTDQNVVSRLYDTEQTELKSITQATPEGNRLGMQDYRLTSSNQSLVLGRRIYDQLIAVSSQIQITPVDQSLEFTQTLNYTIQYQPLQQIRLQIPQKMIDSGVEFYLQDDLQLVPTWTGVEIGSLKEARFSLGEPRLGRFQILVKSALPLPDNFQPDEEWKTALPLVLPVESTPQELRARFHASPSIRMELDSEKGDWKRSDQTQEWISSTVQTVLNFRVTRFEERTARSFRVPRVLLRTTADQQGVARTRGQYKIAGNPSELEMIFPESLIVDALWWNQEPLQREDLEILPGAQHTYRLNLVPVLKTITEADDFETVVSDVENSDNILTIDFHTQTETPLGWQEKYRLELPQFTSNIWVEQTIWELNLPLGHHLLTNPEGLTPQYRWQRDFVFWSRKVVPEMANLSDWVSGNTEIPEGLRVGQGNIYVLSHFGNQQPVSFRVVSRSTLIAIGAGLSLLLAILLIKLPSQYRLPALFALAFIVTLGNLWFASVVELFLQPALLGVTLALIMVFIDRLLNYEPETPILTLPTGPAELIPPTVTNHALDPIFQDGTGSFGSSAEKFKLSLSPEESGEPLTASLSEADS